MFLQRGAGTDQPAWILFGSPLGDFTTLHRSVRPDRLIDALRQLEQRAVTAGHVSRRIRVLRVQPVALRSPCHDMGRKTAHTCVGSNCLTACRIGNVSSHYRNGEHLTEVIELSDERRRLPGKGTLISMLRKMYEIRLAEEALYHAFLSEPMPGTIHQSIGEEAVAVGVCHALRSDDYVTSTHRGHAHAIAKGATLRSFFAEMYAKSTGMSGGMGGSMHLFDKEHGFLGSIGIVGAGLPIANGAALAAQLEGKGQVAVGFFGDGASNQGAVHEAMNLAAVWKLPVLFVCENNLYAVSTPVQRSMAVAQVADRAAAYGMPGVTVDGMDVLAVYAQAGKLVQRARQGDGPSLLECMTYRFKGHSRFEPANYRPSGELEEWMAKDPIPSLRRLLVDRGMVSESELDALKAEVEAAVEDAVAFAKASPDVEPEQVAGFVFA